MTPEDHSLTRTFAGRGAQTKRLEAVLTARQRLAADIMDVRRKFGNKYDSGIRELLEYDKTLVEYQ